MGASLLSIETGGERVHLPDNDTLCNRRTAGGRGGATQVARGEFSRPHSPVVPAVAAYRVSNACGEEVYDSSSTSFASLLFLSKYKILVLLMLSGDRSMSASAAEPTSFAPAASRTVLRTMALV